MSWTKKIYILQLEELNEEKCTKTKLLHLTYKTLSTASYFKASSKLPQKDLKILIFKWRTKMLAVKTNYKSKESDDKCRLNCGKIENQDHIFTCNKINESPKYELIGKMNSENLDNLKCASEVLKNNLDRRNELHRKIIFKVNNSKKRKTFMEEHQGKEKKQKIIVPL